jgi:hypothetical protein
MCDVAAPLQVIEDTVSVVQHVRQERHVPVSVPNIVIGGSYGGCSFQRMLLLAASSCAWCTLNACQRWMKQVAQSHCLFCGLQLHGPVHCSVR